MGHPKGAEDFYVAVQDSENAWAEDEYLRIFARGMDIFFFFFGLGLELKGENKRLLSEFCGTRPYDAW